MLIMKMKTNNIFVSKNPHKLLIESSNQFNLFSIQILKNLFLDRNCYYKTIWPNINPKILHLLNFFEQYLFHYLSIIVIIICIILMFDNVFDLNSFHLFFNLSTNF